METKAFGAPSTNPDLSARTDALEDYTETKPHKKSTVSQERKDSLGAAGHPKLEHLLSDVGKSIEGIALGALPIQRVQPMNANTEIAPPTSPSPAVRAAERNNPELFAPNPPAPSSRIQTQVGWCEVHTLGRPYPELHLEERLEQLNRTLSFRPGVSAFELMDDMTPMIKAVQARALSTKPSAFPR